MHSGQGSDPLWLVGCRDPEIPFALERLASNGFHPTTVFDAGAYRGDFARACFAVWPGCRIACFEALEPRVQELQKLALETLWTGFSVLTWGGTNSAMALNVAETSSSILSEQVPQGFPTRHYPMRTVDNVLVRISWGRA